MFPSSKNREESGTCIRSRVYFVEDGVEGSIDQKMTEKKDGFLRIGGDSDFQGRSHSIFGCLDKLEPEQKTEKSETGSKSLGAPARAPKRVPDHVLHPEKWTKYSLEEDGTEKNAGMLTSDALNRHAALSFMDEIRKRKENSNKSVELESDVVMAEKHVFSKSAIKHKMEVDEIPPKSLLVDGVNIMPEYVIGRSPTKSPKTQSEAVYPAKKTSHSPVDAVCLEHLKEQDALEKGIDNVSSEITKKISKSVGEEKERATFTKRKAKARGGLREHKLSEDDE